MAIYMNCNIFLYILFFVNTQVVYCEYILNGEKYDLLEEIKKKMMRSYDNNVEANLFTTKYNDATISTTFPLLAIEYDDAINSKKPRVIAGVQKSSDLEKFFKNKADNGEQSNSTNEIIEIVINKKPTIELQEAEKDKSEKNYYDENYKSDIDHLVAGVNENEKYDYDDESVTQKYTESRKQQINSDVNFYTNDEENRKDLQRPMFKYISRDGSKEVQRPDEFSDVPPMTDTDKIQKVDNGDLSNIQKSSEGTIKQRILDVNIYVDGHQTELLTDHNRNENYEIDNSFKLSENSEHEKSINNFKNLDNSDDGGNSNRKIPLMERSSYNVPTYKSDHNREHLLNVPSVDVTINPENSGITDEHVANARHFKVIKSNVGNRRTGEKPRKIIEEEGKDGIVLVSLDNKPFPEILLPPDLRQYMHDSDEDLQSKIFVTL